MSRRNLSLVLLLAAFGGIFYFWRSGKRASDQPHAVPPAVARNSEPPDTEAPNGPQGDTLPQLAEDFMQRAAELSPEEAREASIEKAKKTLAIYEETLRYPLFSRPADGSNIHVLEWNELVPIGQPFAVDSEKREIEAHFSLDKMFAGPGEALTGTLEIYRKDGETKIPVAPGNPTGRVEFYVEGKGWQVAQRLEFVRKGSVLVTTFSPSTIAALAQAPVEPRVVARVELGKYFKELPLPFRYATTNVFEIKGLAGDRIKDGSLEISLNVDVKYVAPITIQAGLYNASGDKPLVVYDNWHRPEQTGPQVITLLMFGKAIRESGVDGPYRIKSLHGHVRVPDTEPPEVFWSHPNDPPLTTKAYRAADFSDDVYSSKEKDDKIQQYRDFIANPP